jgi:dTDP-glucose 4,6-dehydratase
MKNMLRIQEKKRFRMVFTSSSEIYGDYRGVMTEEVPLSTPIRQLNEYAITKWANELQIRNSADRFGSETVTLRLFNTYGPGEYYSDYRSVICIFVYRALHRMPYEVFLNHHRSSCYIDDTVRTMANITTNFRPGETYNIAGKEYHDIKTVSDMILEELNQDDSLVKYTDFESHNTLDKKPDVSKASRYLNHHETVDLREGIKRTVEWQKKVYRV